MAAASDTDSVVLETTPKPQIVYRCKKCRRIVATEEYLVAHNRGKGETCFKWKKRSGGMEEPPECTSIFFKKVMCKTSFSVWAAKLAWDTSTGQVCSATVELGSILRFNCTKADWTSAAYETTIKRGRIHDGEID
ncbi:hypothetical protein TIFTF001_012771 [Ficus carica]|uniref:Uncharacterized protein n=1 Tax=Ficus carica TaxID=3494 RepID=A0AA87ZWH8_FICCA|nr:hypothetical protein TIFTF001_012771 [Ficus carica]